MESVVKNISEGNINDKELMQDIFNLMYDFFKKYSVHIKIKKYTRKFVEITKSTDHLLIIREYIYSLIHKYTDLKIKEFINNTEKLFLTMKVVDTFTLNLFLSYCIFYFINNTHSKKKYYVGLDFEFSEGKIALCQLGFFPKRKFKHIFILDPKTLSDKHKELLIKTVFVSKMYKILHGAESLDIPYVFTEFFDNNKDYIMKFTNYMFDTRFLCEYTKIHNGEKERKCSIYDALLYFKVINKNKYDELTNNNTIMGPIQDVQWILKKMSSFHLKYVLYDVLYLKGFIQAIFLSANNNDSILFEHLKYVSPINRFVCLEKFGIINILEKIKNTTDPINNYIIKTDTKNMTLINAYNTIIEKSFLPSIDMKIKNLLEINNFKKSLNLLFKLIVFSIITNKYSIYMNKKDQFFEKIDYEQYVSQINLFHQSKMAILLEKFANNAKIILINIL
jgi:hypothetical protein